MKKHLPLIAAAFLLALSSPAATQTDIPGPPGSGAFGTTVTVLPNGNFVVTDPSFDQVSPVVEDIGAVYLYTPEGALISTLLGSSANDRVGFGGVQILSNGNYVVLSPNWDTLRPPPSMLERSPGAVPPQALSAVPASPSPPPTPSSASLPATKWVAVTSPS